MTLDDETAERIVNEVEEKNRFWSDLYGELVRAGYAARDAEVEELRAERDRLDEAFDRDLPWRYDEVEAQRNQLAAEVEELRAQLDAAQAHAKAAAQVILAILDESPTERETPADEASIQADADSLAAEIHEAWEFQYDQCDHGTYMGGHLNGEPYAMCRLSAERIVRRRLAKAQEGGGSR